MALKVGQLRKDDIASSSSYFTIISNNDYQIVEVDTQNPFAAEDDENQVFRDCALTRASQSSNSAPLFERGKVYYFRFKIQRVPQYYYSGTNKSYTGRSNDIDKLKYSIVLRNESGENEKILTSFSLPIIYVDDANGRGTQSKPHPRITLYYLFEVLFSPPMDSTHLVFKLDRISYDIFERQRNWLTESIDTSSWTAQEREQQWKSYQKWKAENEQIYVKTFSDPRLIINDQETILCELNNIIPQGQAYWKKFGFQSRPSSLIALNKEPIRVGRSGIYEINNGTRITNFMIAPSGNNDIDHFLLDYIAVSEEDAEEGGD